MDENQVGKKRWHDGPGKKFDGWSKSLSPAE
jgi:hypothetical protein